MFPLADYFHVLAVYLLIAAVLCIPPLLPPWKTLATTLNQRVLTNPWRKRLEVSLGIAAGAIVSTALVLISFFNTSIVRLQFDTIEAEAAYFHVFAGFTFMLLPVSLGLIATARYVHLAARVRLGDVLILLFAIGALGMAGSFYHDFLWCGTRTSWYTQVAEGGYDFDLWTRVVGVASRDYQLLGASQGTLAVILVGYAGLLLWRYYRLVPEPPTRGEKAHVALLLFFMVVFLGFFLFVIDYNYRFSLNVTIHALYLGIPLACFLAWQAGNLLAPVERKVVKPDDLVLATE